MGDRDELEPIEKASRETAARAAARTPEEDACIRPTSASRTTRRNLRRGRRASRRPEEIYRISPNSRSPPRKTCGRIIRSACSRCRWRDIVRVHASSGTTGKPTVVGYTRNDIDTWSLLMARSIRAAGGRSTDKIHVAYGYGLFTGGLGAHYGGRIFGSDRHPGRRRLHRAAGPAHRRFSSRHHHGDALLHARHRRRIRAAGIFGRAIAACASAFSALNRGPKACARKSNGAWGCRRSISTACRKS